MEYNELLRQEYSGNNCIFSAGFVEGHPVDTMYLRFEKDGAEPAVILLRPDEMAIIAWLATGVLWSSEMSRMDAPQSNIVLGHAAPNTVCTGQARDSAHEPGLSRPSLFPAQEGEQ